VRLYSDAELVQLAADAGYADARVSPDDGAQLLAAIATATF
jgi:hypothetical protein